MEYVKIHQSTAISKYSFGLALNVQDSRSPANRYKTAIRIATPFSTCRRIMDWSLSATSLSNSTPRLIGPGCMIEIFFDKLFNNFLLIPYAMLYSRKDENKTWFCLSS